MNELYTQGKRATDEKVEEILIRLEERKNYIPSSDRVRREYAYVLLQEHRDFMKRRTGEI